MILETRAVGPAVNLHGAGAKLEVAIYEVERLPRERRRQVRAVVARAVPYNLAGDYGPGRLLAGHLDVRVLLVVFEQDVKGRPVFFYQVALQGERLDLVIGDEKLQVGYARDQLVGLCVVRARGLEVLPHAVAQVLGLADVKHFIQPVTIYVAAGLRGQVGEFFR